MSSWGGSGIVNTYLKFELLYFKPTYLFLFVHHHCERTNGPIGMKLSMSTCGGYGMVIT